MRRAVIGVFKSLDQAKEATVEIRGESLANNYISVVVRSRTLYSGKHQEEFAQELTRFPAEKMLGIFDGYLVQSGPIELPEVGEVMAGGPLAGALVQETEKGLAGNLANYGVTKDHANHYEQAVKDGRVLVVVEADSDYINEIANHLYTYGGRQIEKWSRTTNKPTYRYK
jgi:hypothetical protein